MAIKQFITLEGAEAVVANLKKISDAGEHALNTFRASGQQFVATDQFTNSLNQTSQALSHTSSATTEFREGLHLLRPVLTELGLSLGNVRELGVLARVGIEGLAVALTGALVVAAAKAADAFANMQRSMAFLFGTQGTNALDQLKQSADGMGTSVTNLEPALVALLTALQRISSFKGIGVGGTLTFGSPEQIKAAGDAIAVLEKELLTLGQTGTAAAGEVVKFFETISKIDPQTKKPMGLTLQAFLDLQRSAPEVAKFIGDALQANLGGDIWTRLQKGPVDFLQLLKAIAAQKPTVSVAPIPPTVLKSFEDLKTAWESLLEAVGKRDLGVPTFITSLRDAIVSLTPIISGVISNIANLGTIVAGFFGDLGKLGSAIAGAFKTGDFGPVLAALKNLFVDFFTNVKNDLVNVFGDLPTRIVAAIGNIDWQGAFGALIGAGVAAEQAVIDGFKRLIATIAGLSWEGVFAGLLSAAQTVFQAIQTAWQALVNFINSTKFQAPQPGVGGAPSIAEFGGGGFVSGPGSTTSDSIIARLSNFEYVIRAAAVKFYGVDFMHAVNALRLPKDFFRGFSLGGLVLPPFPSPPRFAQGGLAMAGQSRSLTLVLDGRAFAVAGAKNVVDDLERAADLHNLSRMGRAPGWVR
jgi:hypothetical protein